MSARGKVKPNLTVSVQIQSTSLDPSEISEILAVVKSAIDSLEKLPKVTKTAAYSQQRALSSGDILSTQRAEYRHL